MRFICGTRGCCDHRFDVCLTAIMLAKINRDGGFRRGENPSMVTETTVSEQAVKRAGVALK